MAKFAKRTFRHFKQLLIAEDKWPFHNTGGQNRAGHSWGKDPDCQSRCDISRARCWRLAMSTTPLTTTTFQEEEEEEELYLNSGRLGQSVVIIDISVGHPEKCQYMLFRYWACSTVLHKTHRPNT